jgi:hypothetical protein
LTAVSEAAATAYRTLGFTGAPAQMPFDPALELSTEHWYIKDSEWRPRKYEGKPLAEAWIDIVKLSESE